MEDPERRRVVYKEFRFVKPHRVHRSPEDTVAVWRPRIRSFSLMALAWFVVSVASEAGHERTLAVIALAAGVLSAAAAVKGLVLVRRNRAE